MPVRRQNLFGAAIACTEHRMPCILRAPGEPAIALELRSQG